MTLPLVFGTRGSALARWQTDWVIAQLKIAHHDLVCETRLFTTTGDRNLSAPLPVLGGKGVFTEELEFALRAGEIDVAVHSLKDLPVEDAVDLTLGAICRREDARDVLVSARGYTLATLPRGAHIGTCSTRRAAQLLALRPDLVVMPLRGNVDTRIRKALEGDYDAIVLAAAGLLRLDLARYVSEYLSFDVMLPAPGQAALVVQCRAGDERVRNILQFIDHAPTQAAVTAERTFLEALGGGCSAPVAAYAEFSFLEELGRGQGVVASLDGRQVIRVKAQSNDPVNLGEKLAEQALEQGATELLK